MKVPPIDEQKAEHAMAPQHEAAEEAIHDMGINGSDIAAPMIVRISDQVFLRTEHQNEQVQESEVLHCTSTTGRKKTIETWLSHTLVFLN